MSEQPTQPSQEEPDPARQIPELPPEPEPEDIAEPAPIRIVRRIFNAVGSGARDHRPSPVPQDLLAAFLAWVAWARTGSSSAAYGPEAAFLALEGNVFLAIPLALLTAFTVFVIAASYQRIIERFPAGGGGYVYQALGPGAGLASGSALLVDYVLTVAISLASCSEQLLGVVPASTISRGSPSRSCCWASSAPEPRRAGVGRGHRADLPPLHRDARRRARDRDHRECRADSRSRGITCTSSPRSPCGTSDCSGCLLILFRAFTLGGGTYTGSRRSRTDRCCASRRWKRPRSMRYMAISLALIAAGILFGYLLYQVRPVPGRTLNAVLFSAIASHVFPPGSHIGHALIAITLISSGALLFVAAQTGFLGGPRVLVYMAFDRWVPSRFSSLPSRHVERRALHGSRP